MALSESQKKLYELIDKYCEGRASPEESVFVEKYYDWFESHENHFSLLSETEQEILERELFNHTLAAIEEAERIKKIPFRGRNLMLRLAVAAALIMVTVGIAYLFNRSNEKPITALTHYKGDVEPGHNGAILHLSDGRTVVLDSIQNGTVAVQGSMKAIKENGQLKYEGEATETIYNTITTDRGRQWQLVLPDGTKVWLNAASSITYPLAFNGVERKVKITGEAYFEVVHNTAKPFKVISNGQIVEVLGTQFNINAYSNETSVKTTLLKGSVRVTANGIIKIIKPGQQSAVSQSGISLSEVDPDEVVAWKEGYFDFSDTDIKTIMRQFSRWYDVDIQFEGPATTETFTGRIPRNWSLSQVIKIVQSSKSIHLTIQERRIMVKQ